MFGMNLYYVTPVEFDSLDGFCGAVVYAIDKLHAERLVRVKYQEDLRKKPLKVQLIELDTEEKILLSDWRMY